MKTKKALDAMLAKYADALAVGKSDELAAQSKEPEAIAEYGAEGKVLMNTIQQLHEALRPVNVPVTLAARIREQVRQEIAGRPAPAQAAEAPGLAGRLGTTARAFLRRAGELAVNINIGELLGGKGGYVAGRPAEVYAYSVIEALDKAARRRKARILVDAKGRIYEVPQSALKRYTVSGKQGKPRRRNP